MALEYSTYLGVPAGPAVPQDNSTPDQQGFGIAVDASGSAYITGKTNAPNFPVTAGVVGPTIDLG